MDSGIVDNVTGRVKCGSTSQPSGNANQGTSVLERNPLGKRDRELQAPLDVSRSSSYSCEAVDVCIKDPTVGILSVSQVLLSNKRKGVSYRFRSSLVLISTILLAVLLAALTVYFAWASRYRGLLYTPSIFSAKPEVAVLVIQLLASTTLLAVKECVISCLELFRWSLATRPRGTKFLTFLVLSEATGFMGVVRIMFARPWNSVFVSWRLVAVFRFVVLYMALLTAHFIWLLDIKSQPAYQPLGPLKNQSLHLGIGEFNLTLGIPWPLNEEDSWAYFTDSARAVKTQPTVCHPNHNGSCKAYVTFANPINYILDVPCPSEDEICSANGIFYDIPSYVVEFQQLSNQGQDGLNSLYTHCVNHSSQLGTQVMMCMGAELETSSAIDFLWSICQDDYDAKTCQLGSGENSTRATMFINKADVTMVINLINQTIIDVVSMTERVPYAVNVSQLFAAYTAPLTYPPVNLSVIRQVDKNFTLSPGQSVFLGDVTFVNASQSADKWVDGRFYALRKYLKPQAINQRIYGLVAHALATNSRKFIPDEKPRKWITGEQKTILSVSLVSIGVFSGLTGGILLTIIAVLCIAQKGVTPNLTQFPDVTITAKVGIGMMNALRNLNDAPTGSVLKKVVDFVICARNDLSDGRVTLYILSGLPVDESEYV